MKELCNRQALDKALLVKDNRYEMTKEPTKLVGSFVSSLAAPTGFEPAERNWFDGWVFHVQSDCMVSLIGFQVINDKAIKIRMNVYCCQAGGHL